jgi:hypothetical protein
MRVSVVLFAVGLLVARGRPRPLRPALQNPYSSVRIRSSPPTRAQNRPRGAGSPSFCGCPRWRTRGRDLPHGPPADAGRPLRRGCNRLRAASPRPASRSPGVPERVRPAAAMPPRTRCRPSDRTPHRAARGSDTAGTGRRAARSPSADSRPVSSTPGGRHEDRARIDPAHTREGGTMDRTVIYHGGTLDGSRQTWGPDDPRPDAIGQSLDGHVSIYAFDQEDGTGRGTTPRALIALASSRSMTRGTVTPRSGADPPRRGRRDGPSSKP